MLNPPSRAVLLFTMFVGEAMDRIESPAVAFNNTTIVLYAGASGFKRSAAASHRSGSGRQRGDAFAALPAPVDLLNFDVQRVNADNATIMLRLAHMVAANEPSALAEAVRVDVAALFPAATRILDLAEKMLDGVRPKPTPATPADGRASTASSAVVGLTPLSIRTFAVTVALP